MYDLKTIKFLFVASPLSKAALRGKSKDGLAPNQAHVSKWSDMNCLSADCCFSELAPTKSVGPVQSGPHHHFIEN